MSIIIPIGLGYLAQQLRDSGHTVEIYDARLHRASPDQIRTKIDEMQPGVVGITAINADREETHAIAAIAKAISPNIKVMVGGPYPSGSGTYVLADPNVDVAVIGEAELTVVELVEAFSSGSDLAPINGIVFRDGGVPRMTDSRKELSDLESLNIAWDLLNPPQYFQKNLWNSMDRMQNDHRIAPIFTSRGCPFGCIFCHNLFGKTFRPRSPESVVEEITLLRERYDVRQIEIVDDCFNVSMPRAKAIIRMLLERKIDITLSFPHGLRGDRIDDELLDLFQQVGVVRVSYAIESASPRIQTIIHKGIDLDKVLESIEKTAGRGMLTIGYFIFGFPTETLADMEMTLAYALKSKLHAAEFFYLNPFPGSEIAKMAGIRPDNFYWDLVKMNMNLSDVPDRELKKMNKKAYRKFFLDPKRLYRIWKVHPKNFRLLLNSMLVLRLLFVDSIKGYWR